MFGLNKLFAPRTDFKALQENGAIIIDVRTPVEFHSGHITGSINIPVDQVGSMTNDLKKRNKPVIACCRSGARSSMAVTLLKAAGVEAYDGGAWNKLLNQLS